MASEVGHNKNAANFKSLFQILEEMGSMYNPSNPAITLANLAPIKQTLDDVITTFNQKNPLYKNAVAQRETHMASLSKLTTRIVNSFRASGASPSDIDNADSLARLIRGSSRKSKANPETASPETISTSRMSYDSRTANFDAMINYLERHPSYAPNEDAIAIASLKAINLQQKQENVTVNQTANELLTARSSRNRILYDSSTGAVQYTPIIKSYLKSLGDAGKPYYKSAVRLKFVSH